MCLVCFQYFIEFDVLYEKSVVILRNEEILKSKFLILNLYFN
jgi:hypothetical protein